LLRQLSEPARIQARGSDRASDHCQFRAGWGLVLRLREAGDDRGCGSAPAACASQEPTRTWARRAVRRLAVVGQDEFGDPEIAPANDSSDGKPLVARL